MAIAVEMQRQITALLFIAMVASAEVHQVQQDARPGHATGPHMETSTVEQAAQEIEQMIAEPSFLEQVTRTVKQMDALLADPAILQQAKRVTAQMEELMTVPQVQEQVKAFAERMKEMSSEINPQEEAELVAKSMESSQVLQADPKVQEQVERVKAIFADANFQKQGKRVAEQMEAMLADSSSQDRNVQDYENLFAERSADGMVDTMLDKIVGRTITTPSIDRLDLDSAMVGKSSSLTNQPRRLSASGPRSISAAPLRAPAANLVPFGLSARSAVRTSAKRSTARIAVKKERKTLSELRREQALEKGILDALVPDVLFELSPDLVIEDDVQEFVREAAFLFARLAAASFMVHHGQELLGSSQLFTKAAIDKYFGFLPGPHIVWAYFVGYVQLLAPLFLSVGVFSRAAAASLVPTMLGAFYYSVKATGLEGFPLSKFANKVPIFHNYGFELPALYLSVFLVVAVSGPGKFSVAQALGWNEDKSLLGKLKQ